MSLWNHTALNQQDADHAAATAQKMELDGNSNSAAWSAWLRDTLTDHAEIYRAGAEAAEASRKGWEAEAMEEIDRFAQQPYEDLRQAAREVVACEDAYGDTMDENLSPEMFHRREMAWSVLRKLCALGGAKR